MTTKIWKVRFKENMDRYDVVAKNVGQAAKEAVRLFKASVNERIRKAKARRAKDIHEYSSWSWYVRRGYHTPELIELIAESDN